MGRGRVLELGGIAGLFEANGYINTKNRFI
jgi:hypothetical protein